MFRRFKGKPVARLLAIIVRCEELRDMAIADFVARHTSIPDLLQRKP